MSRHQYLVVIIILSLLAACGGGDQDAVEDGPVPPPGPVRCDINPAICR